MKNYILLMVVFHLVFCVAYEARAHCDTLDGPVVVDARIALDKKDVTPVLKWIKKDHEDTIIKIFNKTLESLANEPQNKEAVELEFFKELVRIHRAGEGASFEELKPAGQVEEIVRVADEAMEKNSLEELNKMVTHGIEERFERVMATAPYKDESVEAGREYVEAYVDYVHYVEGLYSVASDSAGHHAHQEEPGRRAN